MAALTRSLLIFIVLTAALSSCEKLELEVSVPNCIKNKIKDIKQEDVRNPPAKVWRWKVDNKIYYYITSDCCDQFNYLYDDNCHVVCAPDGGISGAGDGSCPNFDGQVERNLIWKDDRK